MRIQTSKKKQTALNLNIYRNLHHRSNNALKVKFKELAEKRLKGMPLLGRIRLHYSIHPKSKRRLDIGNVGSIVDKFFSDVLTESGIIEDDDYKNLDFVSFGFGGLAEEEHVLVTITEIEERDNMQLSMTANLSPMDIQEAIADWVTKETGQTCESSDVVLTDDGATVTVGDEQAETTAPTSTKRKRRTKAQIEADKAAEEAADNDDETVSDSTDSDSGGSDSNPEDETTQETSGNETEGQKPKNDSAESQDESSKGTNNSAETQAENKPTVTKKKKSSIFAQ